MLSFRLKYLQHKLAEERIFPYQNLFIYKILTQFFWYFQTIFMMVYPFDIYSSLVKFLAIFCQLFIQNKINNYQPFFRSNLSYQTSSFLLYIKKFFSPGIAFSTKAVEHTPSQSSWAKTIVSARVFRIFL